MFSIGIKSRKRNSVLVWMVAAVWGLAVAECSNNTGKDVRVTIPPELDSSTDTNAETSCGECDDRFFCSAAGQCIPDGSCLVKADCPCDNTECKEETMDCVSSNGDNQCGKCNKGNFCSMSGRCIPVGECTSDLDCICELWCDLERQTCRSDTLICLHVEFRKVKEVQQDASVSSLCTFVFFTQHLDDRDQKSIHPDIDNVFVPFSEKNGWTGTFDNDEFRFTLNGSFCEMWRDNMDSTLRIRWLCGGLPI